jgi:hypothetical protein
MMTEQDQDKDQDAFRHGRRQSSHRFGGIRSTTMINVQRHDHYRLIHNDCELASVKQMVTTCNFKGKGQAAHYRLGRAHSIYRSH